LQFWFEELYTEIPDFVKSAIDHVKPCIVNDLPDVWVCQSSSVGIFTTKDAYEWLLKPLPINDHVNWKWIWQSKLPANIQFFIWQVLQGSIPTRGVLHHRRVCNSNLCPRCLVTPESIEHCLFRCIDAICVWKACGLECALASLHNGDLFSWCRRACASYGVIVCIIMWVVWCARNQFLFNGLRDSLQESVAKINSLRIFYDSAFNSQLLDSTQTTNIRIVAWSRPTGGFVSLNVDGSLLGSVHTEGFGGLIRNNAGEF
jgi:hypothetical protein